MLPEDKLKNYGLVALEKDISKQHSIDYVVWLLVFTLMQFYNEKRQAEQGKLQMYKLRRKGYQQVG